MEFWRYGTEWPVLRAASERLLSRSFDETHFWIGVRFSVLKFGRAEAGAGAGFQLSHTVARGEIGGRIVILTVTPNRAAYPPSPGIAHHRPVLLDIPRHCAYEGDTQNRYSLGALDHESMQSLQRRQPQRLQQRRP